MNPYLLSLVFLFVGLLSQVTVSALAIDAWLQCEQPASRRRMWLAISLAALVLALHNGYALELAARTGLFDFRQSLLALLAGLLSAYALRQLRGQWA